MFNPQNFHIPKLMKRSIFLLVLIITLIYGGCSRGHKPSHLGERKLTDTELHIDSITIAADSTSYMGNFLMMDSSLFFVDNLQCKIFEFDIKNGQLKQTHSDKGQGPGEMINVMIGSVVHPTDTAMWIFDTSYGIYEFTPSNGKVKYKKGLDFNWESGITDDYTSISCYKPMEKDDYCFPVYQIADSVVIIPLNIVNQFFTNIEPERYNQGKIFGKVNPETSKITDLFGQYPDFYKENPLRYFESFAYTIDYDNSRIYANHAPDSLIYCYDLKGNLLNTLGFEPEGIDREYTTGLDISWDTYRQDVKHVGTNTGLYYDPDARLLLRTSISDISTQKSMLQVYKDNDLVLETGVPSSFKILGKYGSDYYATQFYPIEEENNSKFILYRFSLNL